MLKEKCVRGIPSTSPLLIVFLAALFVNAFVWTGTASAHSIGGGDPVVSAGLAAVSQNSGAAIWKHVFYRGSNGHLWVSATSEPGVITPSTKWSAPTDLGGVQLASAPAAVSRNNNRIDVF